MQCNVEQEKGEGEGGIDSLDPSFSANDLQLVRCAHERGGLRAQRFQDRWGAWRDTQLLHRDQRHNLYAEAGSEIGGKGSEGSFMFTFLIRCFCATLSHR